MYLKNVSAVLLALMCADSIAQPAPPTGTICKHKDGDPTCVCTLDDGGIIDLTGIAKNDGTAMFTSGLIDSQGYTYEFNPCNRFDSPDGQCQNVFVCQTTSDGSASYNIADNNEQIWVDEDHNTPYLYYTGPDNRNTKVFLNCDNTVTGDPEVSTEGDSKVKLSYVFYIRSSKVCPSGAPPSPGGGEDDSVVGIAGLVIIILLLSALIAYFIIGAVIMKVKFNANGLDIIPNRKFWFGLSSHIKDGFIFTFGPCVSALKNRRGGYDKVSE